MRHSHPPLDSHQHGCSRQTCNPNPKPKPTVARISAPPQFTWDYFTDYLRQKTDKILHIRERCVWRKVREAKFIAEMVEGEYIHKMFQGDAGERLERLVFQKITEKLRKSTVGASTWEDKLRSFAEFLRFILCDSMKPPDVPFAVNQLFTAWPDTHDYVGISRNRQQG